MKPTPPKGPPSQIIPDYQGRANAMYAIICFIMVAILTLICCLADGQTVSRVHIINLPDSLAICPICKDTSNYPNEPLVTSVKSILAGESVTASYPNLKVFVCFNCGVVFIKGKSIKGELLKNNNE